MSKLRDCEPAVFAAITEGSAIVGFRNRLIHGYDTVDDAIVWDVVQKKLPTLRTDADRLLAK